MSANGNNETLRAMHAQAEALGRAAALVERAQGEVAASGAADMERECAALAAALKSRRANIEGELRRRFDVLFSAPVLQMRFTGGGQAARIVVSMPDRRCGEPHVSEAQAKGLSALLGVPVAEMRVDGDFAVAVLDNYGAACATIPSSGC